MAEGRPEGVPELGEGFTPAEKNAGVDFELRREGTGNWIGGRTEGQEIRFSKGKPQRSPAEVGIELLELAKDERTRVLGPTPTAKDLPTILQTLAPERAERIEIGEGAEEHGRSYTFKDAQGGMIFLVRDYDDV